MSVFITGASSGIGEACAWEFARAGKDLILMARREERLSALAESIQARHSVKVGMCPLDVRDRVGLQHWVAENASLVDGIDVLVNNAGLARGLESLPKGKFEDWDVMIDTNVKGLLYVTRSLMAAIVANRGHIVNLGSVAGRYTYPNGNVYCATKYAVRALNEAMRLDLHGTGVRVTEIAPGMVETEFSEVRFNGDRERAKSVYAGMQPLTAQDIAETVRWCVDRPKHVDIQEVVIFPVDQSGVGLVNRRS